MPEGRADAAAARWPLPMVWAIRQRQDWQFRLPKTDGPLARLLPTAMITRIRSSRRHVLICGFYSRKSIEHD